MSEETKKPEEVIAMCGGLPLRVSSPVSDILAAVWMGFQISKQTLMPGPGGEQVISPGAVGGHYGGMEAEAPNYLGADLFDMLNSMTPMAREAWLSDHGLAVRQPATEVDPTADTLREMMEGDTRIPKPEGDEV